MIQVLLVFRTIATAKVNARRSRATVSMVMVTVITIIMAIAIIGDVSVAVVLEGIPQQPTPVLPQLLQQPQLLPPPHRVIVVVTVGVELVLVEGIASPRRMLRAVLVDRITKFQQSSAMQNNKRMKLVWLERWGWYFQLHKKVRFKSIWGLSSTIITTKNLRFYSV